MKTFAFAAAFAAAAAAAQAAPVEWRVADGGNGHWYDFVSAGGAISWDSAKAAAESLSFMGMTGYLATVTSVEENTFLTTVSAARGWLGGTDAAVEGTWIWATGPEAGTTFWQSGVGTLTYANWNPGEPNNLGNEDYLHFNYSLLGGWNDIPIASETAYFVEYSGATAVPVPAALPLLVSALGVAGWLGRRRAA